MDVLNRIVCSLAYERSLRQDLMQEGLVHLWQLQQERPGQRKSWYLQNCRFRLLHYLDGGRSLDSPKRRTSQAGDLFPGAESQEECEQLAVAGVQFEQTSANDLMQALATRLKPIERDVLDCLVDGLSTVEIVRRLKLSYPTVVKYRRKIAHLTRRLQHGPLWAVSVMFSEAMTNGLVNFFEWAMLHTT